MPNSLVECIANFSEARRPQVVAEIAQAIISVPGVALLDRHSDMDHNRTVLTFVGPPEEIEESAFRAIAKAAELIDLNQHRGEHPRIGASDVVPFVPISGVDMQACVEIARRLGKRVGEELGIPVYLYEEAATRPERKNLENIRRGEFEGLKTEIGVNPEREPDFGPARLGPAGATVIGARQPLIAYNVYLDSDDISIARKIARTIRHSSGGFRYVKGLGLLVDGRAQVSMNLTNFHGTPMALVVETIRREAARYGVNVHHSELVGLIPQEALVEAAVWYLQMDQFSPDQVLERRLQQVLEEEAVAEPPEAGGEASFPAGQAEGEETGGVRPPQGFLDALASAEPTPGGGSASAYSGAAGAALVAMVARLTLGKKKYAGVQDQMAVLVEQAEGLRQALSAAVTQDAAAFDQVMAAYKLPKDSAEEQAARQQAIERATLAAAQVPLEVAGKTVAVMELAVQAVSLGNKNAVSDAATAAALARAALTGAGYNVRINAIGLPEDTAQPLLDQLEALEGQASVLEERVKAQLHERGGLPQA